MRKHQPAPQPWRTILLVVGFVSLFLGIIGVFLPVLPTVPFILLSAFCFSRSSKRFHDWICDNKWFGPMIIDWENHGVIKIQAKLGASFFLLASTAYGFYFKEVPRWVPWLLVVISISALSFIWTRPSKSQKN